MGQVIEIKLNDAISYNSLVELKHVLDPNLSPSNFKDYAVIACAMKSRKVHIILLIPNAKENKDLVLPNLDELSSKDTLDPVITFSFNGKSNKPTKL